MISSNDNYPMTGKREKIESLTEDLHKTIDITEAAPVKSVMGKAFKKEAKIVVEHLTSLEADRLADLEKALTENR